MRGPLILTVFLVATSAAAQIGNPAGVAPGTQEAAPGMPAPHQTNTEDRLFVRLMAAGGMAEVDFARLAEGKARSQPVQDFARRMVADHSRANRELEDLARAAQIPLPSEPDPEHKRMRSTLREHIRRCIRPRLHARAGRRASKGGCAGDLGDWTRPGRASAAMGGRYPAGRPWPPRSGKDVGR